jgi:NAD(P)-dependent dehydrogenase (short-subunit alcohol dehydrogenase family)
VSQDSSARQHQDHAPKDQGINGATRVLNARPGGTPIKVNAANPGYCATDLNGHSGFRTPQQGAEASVRLATLDEDGPTGTFWGHLWTADGDGGYGILPW